MEIKYDLNKMTERLGYRQYKINELKRRIKILDD
jgi:hypothetical protein